MSASLTQPAIHHDRFGAEVRRRRGKRPLRETAALVGIAFNTLARVERGCPTHADVYLRVCVAFQIEPFEFATTDVKQRIQTLKVEALLRAETCRGPQFKNT